MFFFFKQKTADEMRISDWSSDVCSSDLDGARGRRPPLSKVVACNFAQTYEAAARPQSLVDIRATGSRASLSSTERLCHYPVRPEIGRASGRERVCQYV